VSDVAKFMSEVLIKKVYVKQVRVIWAHSRMKKDDFHHEIMRWVKGVVNCIAKQRITKHDYYLIELEKKVKKPEEKPNEKRSRT
jgi:hypothetical protein